MRRVIIVLKLANPVLFLSRMEFVYLNILVYVLVHESISELERAYILAGEASQIIVFPQPFLTICCTLCVCGFSFGHL